MVSQLRAHGDRSPYTTADREDVAKPCQQALVLKYAGGTLSLEERDIPKPGPGEILVRVEAAAVTLDCRVRKHYPCILGLEAAGDVEIIGEDVDEFHVGDRV